MELCASTADQRQASCARSCPAPAKMSAHSGDAGHGLNAAYGMQVTEWRQDSGLPLTHHVSDLSQELATAMKEREEELQGKHVSWLGDGEVVYDPQWRRMRDMHAAVLEEWKDAGQRYPFLCQQVNEIARRFEVFLDTQGVAPAVIDQCMRTFRHRLMSSAEDAWTVVQTEIDCFRSRGWGNIPIAERAIEIIEDKVLARKKKIRRRFFDRPAGEKTLQMLMEEDQELQVLTSDLAKITSLPLGTPPHEGISQWMLEAIAAHGRRGREVQVEHEKKALRRQAREWLCGEARPNAKRLDPEASSLGAHAHSHSPHGEQEVNQEPPERCGTKRPRV